MYIFPLVCVNPKLILYSWLPKGANDDEILLPLKFILPAPADKVNISDWLNPKLPPITIENWFEPVTAQTPLPVIAVFMGNPNALPEPILPSA